MSFFKKMERKMYSPENASSAADSSPPRLLVPQNDVEYDEEFYEGRPKKLVLLASTPRVGSGVLWDGLIAAGVLPTSTELFEGVHMKDFFKRWGELTKADYLKKLFQYRTNKKGIFGVKAHHQQFIGFRDIFPLENCQAILIERKDKIDQAVSHLLGFHTQQWSSQGAKICEPSMQMYDYYRLRGYLQNVIDGTKFWCNFFTDNGIKPKYVTYKDLSANYAETIASVASWVAGAEIKAADIKPPEKQVLRNELSQKLKERFIKDLRKFGTDEGEFYRLYWPDHIKPKRRFRRWWRRIRKGMPPLFQERNA